MEKEQQSGSGYYYWSWILFPVLFLLFFSLMRKVTISFSSYFLKNQEEEEKDIISHLHDDILYLILSKLPIRDAAITTVLSSRWAPLFFTLPSRRIDTASFKLIDPWFDPDSFKLVYPKTRWVDPLFSILKSRKAPVQEFEIATGLLNRYHEDFYKIFRKLCVSGVMELSITNCYSFGNKFEPYRIPSPVLSCNMVVKLEIVNCDLVVPSKLTGLQAVKVLVLCNVTVADDDLLRMISHCKAIGKLVIATSHFKYHNIVIDAPSLSELVLSLSNPVDISFKNSPLLASVAASFGVNSDFWERYGLPIENINIIGNMYSSQNWFQEVSEGEYEARKLVSFLNELSGVKDLHLNFSKKYCTVSF